MALHRSRAGVSDPPMPAQTIVFDLDGTLIDTAPDLVDTLNVVFAREGLPPVPYDTARNLIGGGARAMIARGIAAEGRVFEPAKLERLSVLLLEELKIASHFEAICGQDTFGIQKPDPEVLRRTIAAAGGSPQRAIMIGDSATDIRTARAAGIPVIAVDFGYSERPVAEFGPDRVISHFAQLPESVAAIFSAQC